MQKVPAWFCRPIFSNSFSGECGWEYKVVSQAVSIPSLSSILVAGSFVEVLGSSNGLTDLKLASKEVRRVASHGFASVGPVSNPEYNLINIAKAGRSRWLGIRPTVRGSAMNPVDHPYGGGEGAQPRGTKRPKTMWGKVTGGHKTRKPKKWSSQFIIKRRPKVR